MTTTTNRPIREIAEEVRKDWGALTSVHARPYINAMLTMNTIDDNYGLDSGESVVAYFLANASTWRGAKAREVKKELNRMLKEYRNAQRRT